MKKSILFILAVAAVATVSRSTYAAGKAKVGLSFSDFATERWARERDEMTKLLSDAGFDVIS